MKLFKRTSITLVILLLIIWSVMFAWVYYPGHTVSVTNADITEAQMLLKRNNITVPDGLMKKKVHAIAGGKVIYNAENKEVYAKKILGKKAFMEDEETFTAENTTLKFDGKAILIEGKKESFADVSIKNVVTEATKILHQFGLDDGNMSAHAYESEDGFRVSFYPEYKGKPVYDSEIEVLIESSGEFSVETIPVKFENTGVKHLPQSVCSALAAFALNDTANGSEVKDMHLGYKTRDGELVPVWAIYTEDENTYYIQ